VVRAIPHAAHVTATTADAAFAQFKVEFAAIHRSLANATNVASFGLDEAEKTLKVLATLAALIRAKL
jgi:mannitol/fructose-specific phosphotransferase system IIA component (Ntr-type)